MLKKVSIDILYVVGAYQIAWMALLSAHKVTAENIAQMPALLMGAILESAKAEERDEEALAELALVRLFQPKRQDLAEMKIN